MAGMNAALSIADQGFEALLVEKAPRLGGLLNTISVVSHDENRIKADEIVQSMVDRVESHPNIKAYMNTEIDAIQGYIGNYKVTLKVNGSKEIMDVSTIIVATGMQEIEPAGLYDYEGNPSVVTQLQLEGLINRNEVSGIRDVVMINCVNSKNEARGCCNIGCHISVKNALALKEQNRDIRVSILYRDLSMVKDEQIHLQAAKKVGIKFIRFPDEHYPELSSKDGQLAVRVHDILADKGFAIHADLLVLTTGFKGEDSTEQIKGQLKVSTNSDGFFQEAHVKLGPLDFPSKGISLCGCARSPKNLKESCEEGIGAAMRVSTPMKQGYVEADGIVADIDLKDCNNCGLCYKRCPFSAIQLDSEERPSVIKALCKGCGLCAADCPKECVHIVHYADDQLLAQVEAALENDSEKKILGFVCHWCALGGVDMAGVSRLQYPPNARLIRVMCSARVPTKLIERAFDLGAGGVLVAGCEFPTCHYITGNYACESRLKRARKRLARKGYDPERLWNVWCSAADGPKFATVMKDMVGQLGL